MKKVTWRTLVVLGQLLALIAAGQCLTGALPVQAGVVLLGEPPAGLEDPNEPAEPEDPNNIEPMEPLPESV